MSSASPLHAKIWIKEMGGTAVLSNVTTRLLNGQRCHLTKTGPSPNPSDDQLLCVPPKPGSQD
eukprot:3037098-Amphidinium_carterae.1